MTDQIMHRKANFGHALCGEKITNDMTTLDDAKVTCEKCAKKLSQIGASESKTIIIHEIIDKDKKS